MKYKKKKQECRQSIEAMTVQAYWRSNPPPLIPLLHTHKKEEKNWGWCPQLSGRYRPVFRKKKRKK